MCPDMPTICAAYLQIWWSRCRHGRARLGFLLGGSACAAAAGDDASSAAART